MDMFDFSQILELLKVEPGHGLVQSGLLFMIWLSSRGVKKEIIGIKTLVLTGKVANDIKFEQIGTRLTNLENARSKYVEPSQFSVDSAGLGAHP